LARGRLRVACQHRLRHGSASPLLGSSENDAIAELGHNGGEVLILHKPHRMPQSGKPLPHGIAAVFVALSCVLLSAQTRITRPDNNYTPAQDVELGRKAAQEMRQQLPLLNDDEVTSYVEGVGRRLVTAIPAEFQHSEFHYTFEVVNVREINASALPGGPMSV